VTAPGRSQIHDLFQQQIHLHRKLRAFAEQAAAAKKPAVG
jgi:hypothetical protein